MKPLHPVLPFLLFLFGAVVVDASETEPATEFPREFEVEAGVATGEEGFPEEALPEAYSEGRGPVANAAPESGIRQIPQQDFIYGAGNGEQEPGAASGTWIERGFSLFGYLLMIGAIAVASLWFFRNHPRFRGNQTPSSRSLRVAETRPLGQKQFLAIVECDERRILVGFSPGRMDFLCNLSQATDANHNEGTILPSGKQ